VVSEVIDIQEPEKKLYTKEAQASVQKEFYLLVHVILIFYLLLHNILIPVVTNLFRSQSLYLDTHYWFLFHLPLQFWLRKDKPIHVNYLFFLMAGSLSRLFYHTWEAEGRSWFLFSVFLSEVSSLIFCSIIWKKQQGKIRSYGIMLGILIPLLLTKVEKHGQIWIPEKIVKTEVTYSDSQLGCRGGEVNISFPISYLTPASDELAIENCGLSEQMIFFNKDFKLKNKTTSTINIRLYELKADVRKRYSWRFVRINRLQQGDEWKLADIMKSDRIYLLKSPERRNLGLTILLPSNLSSIPLKTGTLEVGIDSLNWRSHGT
jgi:hypothetical protein